MFAVPPILPALPTPIVNTYWTSVQPSRAIADARFAAAQTGFTFNQDGNATPWSFSATYPSHGIANMFVNAFQSYAPYPTTITISMVLAPPCRSQLSSQSLQPCHWQPEGAAAAAYTTMQTFLAEFQRQLGSPLIMATPNCLPATPCYPPFTYPSSQMYIPPPAMYNQTPSLVCDPVTNQCVSTPPGTNVQYFPSWNLRL